MPRVLSALADTHRQRADVAWIPLVSLTLWRDRYGDDPQSLTILASTATHYLPQVTGPPLEYLPLIVTTGQVGDSLEALNPETAPASFDPELSNTVPIAADGTVAPRLSALLRNEVSDLGYDRGGGDLTVRWLPPGGVVGVDDVLLYQGSVSTIESLTDETLVVRSTSAEGTVRIPILPAAVGRGVYAVDPFLGVYVDGAAAGLVLDAPFGAAMPPTCTNNPGTCAGPPSFLTAPPDLSGITFELRVGYYYGPGPSSNAYENRYAGFYRALTTLPGTTLNLDLVETTATQWGMIVQTGGGATTTTADALIQILGLPDPLSLANLQAHDHDTIHALAQSSGSILATYSTGIDGTLHGDATFTRFAPPLSLPITGYRFIVVRIQSMPPVAMASGENNFTRVYVANLHIH